ADPSLREWTVPRRDHRDPGARRSAPRHRDPARLAPRRGARPAPAAGRADRAGPGLEELRPAARAVDEPGAPAFGRRARLRDRALPPRRRARRRRWPAARLSLLSG